MSILIIISISTYSKDLVFYSPINLIPFLVFFVPIVDMAVVILSRLKDKKSPFYPDSRHLHHRLIKMNIDIKRILILIFSVSEIFSILALYISKNPFIFQYILIIVMFNCLILFYSNKTIRKNIT